MLGCHRDGDMLETNQLVVGRVEASPPRTRQVNLGPGMGGAVLPLAHLNISRYKSRAKAQICLAASIISTA